MWKRAAYFGRNINLS
nr:4-11 CRISPR MLO8 [Cucumis sativus]